MTLPQSFVDIVRERAERLGERLAFTFLGDGQEPSERLTYAGLDERARAIAADLQRRGAGGERVLLLFPPGLDFVAAFLGCLYAGAVAVPAYPPSPGRGTGRLRSLLDDARPRLALTISPLLERVGREVDSAGIVAVDDLEPGEEWHPPAIDSDSLAFLQYTSGSTSTPKGVRVTHGNLIANERAIQRAFAQSEESVVVGWLPLYHDMGLIGNVLQPLWCGASCVLMSPLSFLQRPRRWLEAIGRFRATTSGGPDFAYSLCARKIPPQEREGLDLSSWKVAFNGAEPVRAETLSAFAEAFASQGFRREAFYPCYGLAEATLFVSGGDPEAAPALKSLDGKGRLLVGCGSAWPGEQLAIVDPETGRELPAGQEGEVWVAGPSVAAGYWNRSEESERTFGARLAGGDGGDGPFLRTGDLGIFDGELFVTGRIKDLIVVRGRNLYPHDLERTAEASHGALRPGGGAAFSVEAEGEERLVIVHEVERRREAEAREAVEAVRAAVLREHEISPHDVVPIRAGNLPKTSSGKVRRGACREGYLAEALQVIGVGAGAPSPAKRGRAGEGEAPNGGAGIKPGVSTPGETPMYVSTSPEGAEDPPASLRDLGMKGGLLPGVETPGFMPAPLSGALGLIRDHAARLLRVDPATLDPEAPLPLDSLLALELKNRLESGTGVSVPLGLLLDGIGPRQLAEELSRGTAAALPALPEVEGSDHPLSHGQRSLWLAHRMAPESPVYNLALAARVELDPETLQRSLERLAERHAVLRTAYPLVDGEPVQRIGDVGDIGIDFAVMDLAPDRIAEEAWKPFDLEHGPVMRARLFTAPGETPVLLLAVHHIAADFWSLGLLLDELGALTPLAPLSHLPAPLPGRGGKADSWDGRGRPSPGEGGGEAGEGTGVRALYAAWARWQREMLAGPEGERLWAEWRVALAGAPAVLDLPSDRPRPPVPSHRGGSHPFSLGPELSGRVRALAAASGATLYAVLLAAFEALLHRHTGREDLLVGSAAAGRTRPGLEAVAGHFVNLLPVRADLSGDPAFSELLARTRRAVTGALDLQDFPFPVLVERLDPARDPSRHPLIQVAFALEQPHRFQSGAAASFVLGRSGPPTSVGGLVLEPVDLPRRATPFDLTLLAVETGGTVEASFEFSADLFDTETAERLAGRFLNLLAAAVADPGLRLSDLPVLGEAERAQLLGGWSDGPAMPVPERCAHELFEDWVDRAPDSPALVSAEGEVWTYGELEARANRLGHQLQAAGVGPETPVALLLERSPDLVVAILGAQKAGGFYVPVDPAHPPERIALMLADSGARAVVTVEALASRVPPGTAVVLAGGETGDNVGRPAAGTTPDNLAYALYTSGSTGRPKAVLVPHRPLASLVRHAAAELRVGPASRVLQVAAPAFDASVLEIFTTLASGAALCLASEEARLSGPRLSGEIRERGVTFAVLTPSAFRFLPEEDLPLETLAIGGEALPGPLAERWSGRARLVNCYGPAETTVYVSSHPCRPGEGTPPIGRPIANARLRVLGPWSAEPLPAGVPGELHVGGVPPARGYLGRPGLAAERWVPDPFGEPGARLYRTGDLVRWRPDGRLEFLGRIDTQVKLRGVRIEPGEIEAALAAHPEVREALVVPRQGGAGEPVLVAYVVPAGEARELSTPLRDFLAGRLPAAMIPAAFVTLAALPVTAVGKVDLGALPVPAGIEASSGSSMALPRTEMERTIAAVWREVLGVETVGIDRNFFELGGHSLLMARAQARLSEVLGKQIPLSEMFSHTTVGSLAAHLSGAPGGAAQPDERETAREIQDRAASRRAAMDRRRTRGRT